MSTKKRTIVSFIAITILILSTGCSQPGGGPEDEESLEVTLSPEDEGRVESFLSAVQTGGISGTADSTALTLTFSADPTTLSERDITVTGATKGVLSGTGTTRSLVISDITVGNGETVTIEVANLSEFTISGSPKKAVVYRSLNIGMAYQGGIIAYILQSGDPGYTAGETHGLIAASADQSTGIFWSNISLTTEAKGKELGTGQTNTRKIVEKQGKGSYAAKLCDDYTNDNTGTGVYSDWYLPSVDELNKLYLNRTVIGGFSSNNYWSSTEIDIYTYALYLKFGGGEQYAYHKSSSYNVRAVRSF